jgi:predicted ATP-dependent serine protease
MPPEYANKKMVVLCNDCGVKSCVPFHIVGGKCKGCRSYNTTRIEDPESIKKFYEEFPEERPEEEEKLEEEKE